MSPITRIGGGISVASRGVVLGEGIRVPAVAADGGPTIFLTDNFTDTSATLLTAHTSDSGATYAKHAAFAADLQISGANRLRASSGSTAIHVASVVPGSAEYDVTAVMVYLSTTGTTMTYGVVARCDPTAQTWYTAHYASATTTWTLDKRVAGVNTTLGTYVGDAIASGGGTRTLKLEIRDATKKVFVDGAERISSVDNEITGGGRVGPRGVQSTPNDVAGIQIDSLVATTV